MSSPSILLRCFAGLLCALSVSVSTWASAQEHKDGIVRENEVLREDIEELRSRLDALEGVNNNYHVRVLGYGIMECSPNRNFGNQWAPACSQNFDLAIGAESKDHYTVMTSVPHLDFVKDNPTPIWQVGVERLTGGSFKLTLYSAYHHMNHATVHWIALGR